MGTKGTMTLGKAEETSASSQQGLNIFQLGEQYTQPASEMQTSYMSANIYLHVFKNKIKSLKVSF